MEPPESPRPLSAFSPRLFVGREEAGLKLLRFLERRLEAALEESPSKEGAPDRAVNASNSRLTAGKGSPAPVRRQGFEDTSRQSVSSVQCSQAAFTGGQLHKWIRTGQVRVNGKRAKPFALLEEGDEVRVPPFAFADGSGAPLARGGVEAARPEEETDAEKPGLPALGGDLPIIARRDDILVVNKPGGLSVQPGSGRPDSVVARLRAAFAGRSYIPAPAHRLDRHTSGLLLVGLTHKRQRYLHALFARGGVDKDYLAWVYGCWEPAGIFLLTDRLKKGALVRAGAASSLKEAPVEGMRVLPGGSMELLTQARQNVLLQGVAAPAPEAGEARCIVQVLRRLTGEALQRSGIRRVPPAAGQGQCGLFPGATLVRVRLLTGRTHQIRVQLASRGHPIIGDGRYGGPAYSAMLLHAWRLQLPGVPAFSAPPPWAGVFAAAEE